MMANKYKIFCWIILFLFPDFGTRVLYIEAVWKFIPQNWKERKTKFLSANKNRMDCEKIIRLMIIPRVDWKKMLFWALCKIIIE